MLMNAKIEEIIYAEGYPDELSELMLLESDIKKRRFTLPQNEVSAMIGDYSLQSGED
jgi:dCMP deaminase